SRQDDTGGPRVHSCCDLLEFWAPQPLSFLPRNRLALQLEQFLGFLDQVRMGLADLLHEPNGVQIRALEGVAHNGPANDRNVEGLSLPQRQNLVGKLPALAGPQVVDAKVSDVALGQGEGHRVQGLVFGQDSRMAGVEIPRRLQPRVTEAEVRGWVCDQAVDVT